MQKYSIDVNAYIKVLFVDTETWWLIHKRKTLCSMDRIQTCSWNLFSIGDQTLVVGGLPWLLDEQGMARGKWLDTDFGPAPAPQPLLIN